MNESPVERIKKASEGLRGTLKESLLDEQTGAIRDDDQTLIKFHGMYMQDDRDRREERAEKFLNSFIEYTLTLQNPDGSFSTEWFERRGDEQNVDRKVQTTGHIAEWLIYTLPDDHLRSPEVEKAVDFLLNTIGKNPSKDWAIGPRGHSLRALDLYQKRVFKGQEISTETNLAKPTTKMIQR
jgi:hypothetical protein